MKLARGVSALMAGFLIDRTPQPRVLWNSDQATAARLDGPMEVAKNEFVLEDMLDDIEGRNYIELFLVRQLARIHLLQLDGGQTLRCECEPCCEDFAPGDSSVWERLCDA